MTPPQNIAVYSTSSKVSLADVEDMVAAINTQIKRDYRPIWGRTGNVVAVADKSAVPAGYTPAAIMDDIGEPGALGFHTDENNQPQIFIDVNDETSVTLSHEVLECLTDPSGNRLIAVVLRGERVMLLCEVCDPNEAESYEIGGVAVSNFYKPEYFDGFTTAGFKYDFLEKNSAPLYCNIGGYISYMKNGEWYQDTFFDGDQPVTRGPLSMTRLPNQSLREMIDQYMMIHNWNNTI